MEITQRIYSSSASLAQSTPQENPSRVTLILILLRINILPYTLDEFSPSSTKTVVPFLRSEKNSHKKVKITTLSTFFYISQFTLARWKCSSLAWEISLKDVSGKLKGNDGNIAQLSVYDVQYTSLVSLVKYEYSSVLYVGIY